MLTLVHRNGYNHGNRDTLGKRHKNTYYYSQSLINARGSPDNPLKHSFDDRSAEYFPVSDLSLICTLWSVLRSTVCQLTE